MSIIDEDAEVIFLLEFNNLVKETECSGHSIHTLGDEEDSAAGLLAELGRPLKSFLAAFIIVVTVGHTFSHVQTGTVDKARVSL